MLSCFILFLIFISYFYVVTGACVIMLCCRTRYTTHTCYDTCGSAPYLSRSSCSLAGLFLRHFTELQTVFLSSFFFFFISYLFLVFIFWFLLCCVFVPSTIHTWYVRGRGAIMFFFRSSSHEELIFHLNSKTQFFKPTESAIKLFD